MKDLILACGRRLRVVDHGALTLDSGSGPCAVWVLRAVLPLDLRRRVARFWEPRVVATVTGFRDMALTPTGGVVLLTRDPVPAVSRLCLATGKRSVVMRFAQHPGWQVRWLRYFLGDYVAIVDHAHVAVWHLKTKRHALWWTTTRIESIQATARGLTVTTETGKVRRLRPMFGPRDTMFLLRPGVDALDGAVR